MACYSTVTQTKMTDAARLAEAMQERGYTVAITGGRVVSGTRSLGTGADVISFTRYRVGEAFVSDAGADAINSVARKYSEIGVRAWARAKGFSVALAEQGGRKLTLVNRRGG